MTMDEEAAERLSVEAEEAEEEASLEFGRAQAVAFAAASRFCRAYLERDWEYDVGAEFLTAAEQYLDARNAYHLALLVVLRQLHLDDQGGDHRSHARLLRCIIAHLCLGPANP